MFQIRVTLKTEELIEMAPIKFSFSNLQLLQLLHEHLVLSGLLESAVVLQKEAKLEPLVDIVEQQQPVYPVGSMISFTPSDFSHRHSRPQQEEEEKREELSLTSLVSSKLTEQFKSCKKCRTDRTFTTAIVRDILLPHKCPPRWKMEEELSFTERFFMSQTGTGRNVDKKAVYSRFWPVKDMHKYVVYDPGYLDEEELLDLNGPEEFITSVAFTGDRKSLLVGCDTEYLKVGRCWEGCKLMIVAYVRPEDRQGDEPHRE